MALMRGIVFLCLALTMSVTALAAGTPKPSSPISLQIEALTAAVAGGAAQFRVSVTPMVDVDSLTVTVRPPHGFTLTDGALSWRGAASAHKTVSFEFSGTLPTTPGQMFVATARVSHGMAHFGASATFLVDGGLSQKPQAGGRPVMREGRPVLEIPLNTPNSN